MHTHTHTPHTTHHTPHTTHHTPHTTHHTPHTTHHTPHTTHHTPHKHTPHKHTPRTMHHAPRTTHHTSHITHHTHYHNSLLKNIVFHDLLIASLQARAVCPAILALADPYTKCGSQPSHTSRENSTNTLPNLKMKTISGNSNIMNHPPNRMSSWTDMCIQIFASTAQTLHVT